MKRLSVILCILLGLVFHTKCYARSHQLADQYWNNAQQLDKQGRYLEAARMYEKGAEAEKSSSNLRLSDLSAALDQAGCMYYKIGKYDKAIKHFEQALAIDKKLGQEPDLGSSYNSWCAIKTWL